MNKFSNRLHSADYEVRCVSIGVARRIVKKFHYARGASNTATYLHGLFKSGELWEENCLGCAWWIPPTKSAAMATFKDDWKKVLALSRLVVVPGVPKNACSFLLARSVRMIDRNLWPALVTYADEWQGHTGTIYKASNWTEIGKTSPEACFVKNGRMVARKAGPKTRTIAEMKQIGAEFMGRFSKIKFVNISKKHAAIKARKEPAE